MRACLSVRKERPEHFDLVNNETDVHQLSFRKSKTKPQKNVISKYYAIHLKASETSL